MAGLDALVIGGMRHDNEASRLVGLGGGQDAVAFGFGILEMLEQHVGIGLIEVPAAVFLFGLAEHIAIAQRDRRLRIVERHVHDMGHPQHIHRQPFQPIGQLARNRAAVMAAHLLEIGELRHFHAVAPHFPAQPPGTQRGAFPVILDKADIVQAGVDADGLQRPQIQVLHVGRRGFDQHLELVVMLQAVRVFAIAPVRWPARRLHIGRSPGF